LSKEIQQIIKTLDKMPDGDRAVLATVVDLKGSGYRLPGARMLITEDGDTSAPSPAAVSKPTCLNARKGF